MCLRFVFLLITRLAAWLRLSRREEAWKTAEILILRLCRAKTRTPALSWYFLQPLGCSPVLADQALDGVPALDPAVMSIAWPGSCRGGLCSRAWCGR
jgi:hypothetical protein